MVVAGGREFNQNLAHDAYAGFLQILINGDGIKFMHDLTAHAVKGKEIHVLCGNKFLCTLHPFSVHGIHAAGLCFIRAHTVNAAHENVSEGSAVCGAQNQVRIQMKTGIALNAGEIQGNDGNLLHAGLF